MKISDRLANCCTIEDLERGFTCAEPSVHWLTGSRRFVVSGDSGSLALKDLIRRLDQLFKDLPKTNFMVDSTLRLVKVIRELDVKANQKLSTCWIGARALHFVLSWLSSLRFNRVEILYQLERQAQQLRLQYTEQETRARVEMWRQEQDGFQRMNNLSLEQLLLETHAPVQLCANSPDERARSELKDRLNKRGYDLLIGRLRSMVFSENEPNEKKYRLELVEAIRALSTRLEIFGALINALERASAPCLYYSDRYDARSLPINEFGEFLKGLPWSAEDEQLKAKFVPQVLSYCLATRLIDLPSVQIDQARGSYIGLRRINLDIDELVGKEDHRNKEQLLSKELIEAIGQYLESCYLDILANSKKEHTGLPMLTGLALNIWPGNSSRFQITQLDLLFERLKQVPGLGYLQVSESYLAYVLAHKGTQKAIIGKENAAALLELLRANPFLCEIHYNGQRVIQLGEQKIDELIAAKKPWKELFESEKDQNDLAEAKAQALLEPARTNSTAVQDPVSEQSGHSPR